MEGFLPGQKQNLRLEWADFCSALLPDGDPRICLTKKTSACFYFFPERREAAEKPFYRAMERLRSTVPSISFSSNTPSS